MILHNLSHNIIINKYHIDQDVFLWNLVYDNMYIQNK